MNKSLLTVLAFIGALSAAGCKNNANTETTAAPEAVATTTDATAPVATEVAPAATADAAAATPAVEASKPMTNEERNKTTTK